jgi:hypothetical protein
MHIKLRMATAGRSRFIALTVLFLPFVANGFLQELCQAQETLAIPSRAVSQLPDSHIYTWIGNTPAWNRQLHVSGYRLGCDSGDPDGCVSIGADAVDREGITTIFLSMPEVADRTPADAREYNRLRGSNRFVMEAGFDDFVDRYQKFFSLPGMKPQSWLREVAHNVMADGKGLKFGITLYEDELDSRYLREPLLPHDIAQNVSYVHLYLHYRTNASRFPKYVARAKALFPRAKIIAGLYAYDRIDYIPCTQSNRKPCSEEEEIGYYEHAVRNAAQLMRQGSVSGIEFYPGFFGRENQWPGWKNPGYCVPSRVNQCIENTRIMRQKTLAILEAAFGW